MKVGEVLDAKKDPRIWGIEMRDGKGGFEQNGSVYSMNLQHDFYRCGKYKNPFRYSSDYTIRGNMWAQLTNQWQSWNWNGHYSLWLMVGLTWAGSEWCYRASASYLPWHPSSQCMAASIKVTTKALSFKAFTNSATETRPHRHTILRQKNCFIVKYDYVHFSTAILFG